MTIGVYRIRSLSTNKNYWGSSNQIERRFYEHKSFLKRGLHANINLQKIVNDNGFDDLVFEIVEKCNLNELENIEQKYLDLDENKLNIWVLPHSPKGCKRLIKRKYSEKTKKKISDSVKKSHHEKGHPLLGKKMKEETKIKIGKANKNRKWSEESKLKIKGRVSPTKGKSLSEETKRKISEKNKGKLGYKKGFVKDFPIQKKCNKCNIIKEINQFGFSGKWYRNICKICKESSRKPRL